MYKNTTLCSDEELTEIKALVGGDRVPDLVTDIQDGVFVMAPVDVDDDTKADKHEYNYRFSSAELYGVTDIEYAELLSELTPTEPIDGIHQRVNYELLDLTLLDDRLEYLTKVYHEGFGDTDKVLLPDNLSIELMENLMEEVRNKIKSIKMKIERYKKLDALLSNLTNKAQK